MKVYADCVIAQHQEGNLVKGTCEMEFATVKACEQCANHNNMLVKVWM
jgi:hypothetical protein